MFGAPLDCLRPTRPVPAAQLRAGERAWGQTRTGTAIVTVRDVAVDATRVAADTDAGPVEWRPWELVAVVLPELELAGDDTRAVVHQCGCGSSYTGETWGRLASVGGDVLDDGVEVLDLRLCAGCGSTRSRSWCAKCGTELGEDVAACPRCHGNGS
jgi:hypothetical protein